MRKLLLAAWMAGVASCAPAYAQDLYCQDAAAMEAEMLSNGFEVLFVGISDEFTNASTIIYVRGEQWDVHVRDDDTGQECHIDHGTTFSVNTSVVGEPT